MTMKWIIGYLLWNLLKCLAFYLPISGMIVFSYFVIHEETAKTKILTLLLGLCYFIACFTVSLARICKLRRKPHARNKPTESLWDTDLEFTNDSEKVPFNELNNPRTFLQNFLFKNPYEFCLFRPAYGMFLLTGLVFLAFIIFFMTIAEEWSMKNDYYMAADQLISSTTMIIIVMYMMSNAGVHVYHVKPRSEFYVPFHEYVHVPMQVKARKAFAIFITAGGTHCVLALFVVLLVLLGMAANDTMCALSDEALKTVFHGFSYKPHNVMQTVLAASVISCIVVLLQMMLSAKAQAKQAILGILEKNWERNLVAIQFILQDTKCETLQSLREALDVKGNDNKTRDELCAFLYITRPLWWTKQPFSGRWRKAVPEDIPAERIEEDIPQREQAVEEDPTPVEQEQEGYVEEEADTENEDTVQEEDEVSDENEAIVQEGEQQESRGYELRPRRPIGREQPAPEDIPAGRSRPRKRRHYYYKR